MGMIRLWVDIFSFKAVLSVKSCRDMVTSLQLFIVTNRLSKGDFPHQSEHF